MHLTINIKERTEQGRKVCIWQKGIARTTVSLGCSGANSWQVSRLARNVKNVKKVNITYML